MIMSNNIFKFPSNASRAQARKPRADAPIMTEAILDNQPRALSTTAMNGHLRDKRHEVWQMAESATRYWKHRIDFERALETVQRRGMLEGSYHPAVSQYLDQSLVDKWRAALVRQLLTPAWDTASVKWKQVAFAGGQHRHTDVKPERIERAISEDLAFLAAHPVRQSKCKTTGGLSNG
jgi:hypothetical protein